MLTVNSIKKGIIIDHITAGLGIKIFEFLKLNEVEYPVALLMNVPSKKMGKKDIIKIENELNIDYSVLGLIDHNITVNIIKDEKIVEKKKIKLPEKVVDIINCNNPRCVTSVERNVTQIFHLINEKTKEYRCEYCDNIMKFK
ncbi:MAG: aspartate carbamoyltransferase regulatory subunit [Mollicutes bacterium]|jgi:aspartate carbamoyltransferase regulatory subunit|nr:aspartate carbamoyltransferase regulatory subunit [Mollicutes bacterium]